MKEKTKHSCHCAAINCRNNRGTESHLSFFRFPKDPERSKKWLLSTRRLDLMDKTADYLYKNCTLCASHFDETMFLNVHRRNKLASYAVPTRFNFVDSPRRASRKKMLPVVNTVNVDDDRPSSADTQCAASRSNSTVRVRDLVCEPPGITYQADSEQYVSITRAVKNRNSGYCAAPNCGNQRGNCPGKSFFLFPKEADRYVCAGPCFRCRRWIVNCRRDDLLHRDVSKVHRNCSLCMDHFEAPMFSNSQKNRLRLNAVPTIFAIADSPELIFANKQSRIIETHEFNEATKRSKKVGLKGGGGGRRMCESDNFVTSRVMSPNWIDRLDTLKEEMESQASSTIEDMVLSPLGPALSPDEILPASPSPLEISEDETLTGR